VFLAHYTGSGINAVLDMEVPLFERMLEAAEKVKEAENKLAQYVILVEPKD
jgi:hypothetical protein